MTTVQTHDITQRLTDALHQTFNLYQETHLAHWNVRGPFFPQLHVLFDQQYNELWAALDVLAERIRSLGGDVPGSVFQAVPRIDGRDAQQDIRHLAAAHRAVATTLRGLESAATGAGDPATADLAIERVRAHDQHAWFLEATSDE